MAQEESVDIMAGAWPELATRSSSSPGERTWTRFRSKDCPSNQQRVISESKHQNPENAVIQILIRIW